MSITVKEKLIKRLKKGFGIVYPADINWVNRMGHWSSPGISWQLGRIKCYESATIALTWNRWVLADDSELIEYLSCNEETYKSNGWKIENLTDEDKKHCSYCKHYCSLVDNRMYCRFHKKRITARKKACKEFDLN